MELLYLAKKKGNIMAFKYSHSSLNLEHILETMTQGGGPKKLALLPIWMKEIDTNQSSLHLNYINLHERKDGLSDYEFCKNRA